MTVLTLTLNETDCEQLAEIQAQLNLSSKEEAMKEALRFRYSMLEKLKEGDPVIFHERRVPGEIAAILRSKRKPLTGGKAALGVRKEISEDITLGSLQFESYEIVGLVELDSAKGIAQRFTKGRALGKSTHAYLNKNCLPHFAVGKLNK
jgi:hypothetical protein